MKFNDIRKKAKELNINTYRMKKTDMIRSIQRAENNPECYGTPRVKDCNEERCLWRPDCLEYSENED
ncbi:MAG: Rho termination factor N-terminal domain-containing protein [Deltaproteobacteria bacterium]|nr:Rho termination factor N-terminal domain-containing protein [Deltaproteobacteria bacterium]